MAVVTYNRISITDSLNSHSQNYNIEAPIACILQTLIIVNNNSQTKFDECNVCNYNFVEPFLTVNLQTPPAASMLSTWTLELLQGSA